MPGIADNALVKAARYVEALGAYEPPRDLIPEARGFLEAVLGEAPPLDEALARAQELHRLLCRARRAAALAHAVADDDRRVPSAERDPGAVRGDGGLSPAARADARGRRAADPGRAGQRELRARVDQGERRNALGDPGLRSGMRSRSSSPRIEPGAKLAPMACPASRIATTCARRTGQSRTASSRSRRWMRSSRRSSSTPRTSASPSTTSSSASTCCARPRSRCWPERRVGIRTVLKNARRRSRTFGARLQRMSSSTRSDGE